MVEAVLIMGDIQREFYQQKKSIRKQIQCMCFV